MKKILLLVICFCSLQGFSQSSGLQSVKEVEYSAEVNPTTDIEFLSFLKTSVDFYKSADFLESRKLETEFNNKVGTTYTKVQCTTEDFKNWIEANLSNTNFKSVDEAISIFDKMQEAIKKSKLKENNILDMQSSFSDKYGEDVMSLYRAFMAALIVSN